MIALGIDAGPDGVRAALASDPTDIIHGRDLRQVWQEATRRAGRPQGAVLTAPAGGMPGDRRSLLRAARNADIDVFRVISAPAAAALEHASRTGNSGTFAVLDLRRNAFDCSLVSVDASERAVAKQSERATGQRARRIEVLAGVGFADLGADAVDLAITEALQEESGATHRDLSTLRLHARRAREAMSDHFDTLVQVRLPGGAGLDRRLNRHQMSNFADRVRRRWMDACRRAIAEAESHPAWIDAVLVLDHGPMLRRVVRRCFNRPPIVLGPDAPAAGAARYARILAGDAEGPLILERSTHGLALEARDGTLTQLLPAGIPLPASVACRSARGDRLVHFDWRGAQVGVEALEFEITRVFLDADGVVRAE
jgi:molecular chaperone DnaK (HSP70)